MPNRFIPIAPGTDQNQQLAVINKNFAELDNENVKKLFYDSTGTPSVYIGVDNTGKSVIKVAKSGKDVTTATNADLAFNSSQNTLKVVASGKTTVTVTSTGTTISTFVPHSLGYAPVMIATVTDPFTNSTSPCPFYSILASGVIQMSAQAWSSSTGFSFQASVSTAGGAGQLGTFTFYYYALQETSTV